MYLDLIKSFYGYGEGQLKLNLKDEIVRDIATTTSSYFYFKYLKLLILFTLKLLYFRTLDI